MQLQLWEAIALGRTLVCPAIGGKSPKNPEGSGCALDMAVLSVGGTHWDEARELWPWLGQRCLEEMPWNCCEKENYFWAIAISFDSYVMSGKITLDQLIDWVRSVEPPAAPPVSGEQEQAKDEVRIER